MRDKAFTLHPAWLPDVTLARPYQVNVNSPST